MTSHTITEYILTSCFCPFALTGYIITTSSNRRRIVVVKTFEASLPSCSGKDPDVNAVWKCEAIDGQTVCG